jgi:hypothetical protein
MVPGEEAACYSSPSHLHPLDDPGPSSCYWVAVLGKVAAVPSKLGKRTGEEAEDYWVVEVMRGLLSLATGSPVVVPTLSKVYPRLTTTLLRLGESCGDQEVALSELYPTDL